MNKTKKLGRIFGEIIDNKFTFASKQFFSGDFVKILEDEKQDDTTELICEVIGRGISNKFLTTPDIIKYLDDDMDFQRDTIYTYKVIYLGVVKNGKLSQDNVNPIPGKSVYAVATNDLRVVYGIDEDKLRIGYMKKMQECIITMDINRIFNPHLFVVGKTGSGKSFFMKKYLSFINENYWLFAPSDEYNKELSSTVNQKEDYILELNVDNISYYANLNASEEMILRNINFQGNKVYSNKELVEEIYEYYQQKKKTRFEQMELNLGENVVQELELPAYANSLIGKLKIIRNLKFAKGSKEIQIPKEPTIFDIGGYTQQEQECIMSYYLFKLLVNCKKTKSENRKKHIVIIEEAHNYVPSTKSTLCKEIIVRLSREGRKYGISICFITQRPRFFDQTVLSQCGNKIIFSLPNPDDVRHIMEDIPFYKPDLAFRIQNQRTGECVIVGDAYNGILETVIEF